MRSVRAETSSLDQKPVRDSAQAAAVPIECKGADEEPRPAYRFDIESRNGRRRGAGRLRAGTRIYLPAVLYRQPDMREDRRALGRLQEDCHQEEKPYRRADSVR